MHCGNDFHHLPFNPFFFTWSFSFFIFFYFQYLPNGWARMEKCSLFQLHARQNFCFYVKENIYKILIQCESFTLSDCRRNIHWRRKAIPIDWKTRQNYTQKYHSVCWRIQGKKSQIFLFFLISLFFTFLKNMSITGINYWKIGLGLKMASFSFISIREKNQIPLDLYRYLSSGGTDLFCFLITNDWFNRIGAKLIISKLDS